MSFSRICKVLRKCRALPNSRRLHRKSRRHIGGALSYPRLPPVTNDNLREYIPGSDETNDLAQALREVRSKVWDVPCIVDGEEIRTGDTETQRIPSDHANAACQYHKATPEVMRRAIESCESAKAEWMSRPIEERLAVFTKASWILANERRFELMAATMWGTSKNVWQAEIDAGVETVDFWRFGAQYVQEMYHSQPDLHDEGVWNYVEYRPLEGFTVAITPFNFCAIGANLCTTPAMVGNTNIWKPSSTSVLSNYITYKILEEAGLPPGVINFLPCSGKMLSDIVLGDIRLAAVNFTGSTQVFGDIWGTVAKHLRAYKTYPRLVGETGGKNFHMVHSSAASTLESVMNHTLRGAFEYQGQKCSATSRVYIPRSLASDFKEGMKERMSQIKVGSPDEFDSFMCAVIDKNSFENIEGYISHAKSDSSCEIVSGGGTDGSKGYFVEPTLIETTDPHYQSMEQEIFGPVLTMHVYDDDKFEEALRLCEGTSVYGLTGAIFAQERWAIEQGKDILRNAAGNFYVNDKCTGSIVGQQPFGGARASGTNDKAGFREIYRRFVSIRSIKENFVQNSDWRYPHMS